jgi:NADPH:quinone reductase-like Zn-dependent oxidoreductase
MRALRLHAADGVASLRVDDIPVPVPRRGQVLVRVLCSPVNPSDVLFCEGRYGTPPVMPVVPGFEGCGVVVDAGGGFLARRLVGARVAGAVQGRQGFWAEYVVLNALETLRVPDAVDDHSAASALVNPLTALALARPVLRRRHRAMVQTAAASQVGRMLIRLSVRHGFPLISIVHRAALVDELTREGASRVLDSSAPDFHEALHAATRTVGATWAADAVGGEMTGWLATGMPRGSTIAVYGALAGRPSQVEPGDLIFRQQTVTGYWLSQEFQDRSPLGLVRIAWHLSRASQLLSTDLRSTAQARVALDEAAARLPVLLRSTSAGKIYLTPGT